MTDDPEKPKDLEEVTEQDPDQPLAKEDEVNADALSEDP